MSRGPWKYRPTVLEKALTAARDARARVKIDKDGVEIDFGNPATAKPAPDNENPWDEVLTDGAHEKRPA